MGGLPTAIEEFDIVLVGAGTAGCVLANRLTEDSNISVLVLEAGQDLSGDENVYTPGLSGNLLGNEKYDWKYVAEPDAGINGRQIIHPRGKIVGGTSAINSFALIYPCAAAIDFWAKGLGNKGWDWKGLEQYFKKFQTIGSPPPEVKKELNLAHSDANISTCNGPLHAAFPPTVAPLQKAWVDTFRALGLENRSDPLEGHALGGHTSTCHLTVRRERSHAGIAFLDPVRSRTNLKIVTGVMVHKVDLEKGQDGLLKATGVQYEENGTLRQAKARREVVLSAGVFNTPQLLELSGIGDPNLLQKHGIEVKYANSRVGESLQDHIKASISFEAAESLGAWPAPEDHAREEYEKTRTGPWSNTAYSFAYLPLPPFLDPAGNKNLAKILESDSTSSGSDFSKAQSSFIRSMTVSPDQATTTAFLSRRPAIAVKEGSYITLSAMLSYPLSTGSVHIKSADVSVKPVIKFNYYSNPLDLEVHARHIQSLYKIAQTEPLASYLKPQGRTLPPGLDASTLEGAKEICRNYPTTNYHPCGTASMLPEELGGVVSDRLVVYGTSNLRVVDASIVPIEPRGNIITLVYSIAEKAADIISQDLGLRRTT